MTTTPTADGVAPLPRCSSKRTEADFQAPRPCGSAGSAFLICRRPRRRIWPVTLQLGHAVQIEPSLRPRSPKNGNFPNVCWRLSAISLRKCPNSEPGDRRPIRKRPPLAALSASISGTFSERRTAWLTWEDSNFHIPILKNAFEMSTEFRLFWPKIGLGDFCSCKL